MMITTDDQSFIKDLRASETGQRLVAERQLGVAAEREKSAQLLNAVRVESGKANAAFAEESKKLFAEHERLRRELIAVGAKLNSATATHLAQSSMRAAREAEYEQTLRESADSAIKTFVDDIDRIFEANRHSLIVTIPVETRSRLWGGRVRVVRTNSRAVQSWSEELTRARSAAVALELEIDQSGIKDRLAELAASITPVRDIIVEDLELQPPQIVSSQPSDRINQVVS
jgi:hypothetical protein